MTRTVKLGDVCGFIRGVTFDKAEVKSQPGSGLIPILRAGNIQDELNVRDDLVWVPQSRVSDEQKLRKNDIAICMSSGSSQVVGKTAQVYQTLEASVGSFCGIIRPKNPAEASYLSYFFRSPVFKKHRDAIARGANIQNLRFSQFEEIDLDIPADQELIAGILEQADRLRRLRRYALQLGDAFLGAAFVSTFGDLALEKNRWKEVPLATLVRREDKINYGVVQPGNDLKEGIPLIRVADLDDLEGSSKNLKRIGREIDEQHSASRLHGDELLVACVGSIGKVTKAFPELRGCNIARAVARIPGDWDRINRDFLAEYLKTRRVQHFFASETRTVSQPTLNIKQILESPVIMPPLCLQQRFAAIVERHDRLRQVHRESLRQAEHLFQTLLHRAFTTGL